MTIVHMVTWQSRAFSSIVLYRRINLNTQATYLSVGITRSKMDCNSVDRQFSITPPSSPSAEEHLSTECKYILHTVQHEDGYMCYVWLRKCVCGQRADKSYLSLTGKLALVKQDGVDIHLSDVCDWEERSVSGINLLKRNCFEETHLHSAGLHDVNHVM